jgi:hypothetical protein
MKYEVMIALKRNSKYLFGAHARPNEVWGKVITLGDRFVLLGNGNTPVRALDDFGRWWILESLPRQRHEATNAKGR